MREEERLKEKLATLQCKKKEAINHQSHLQLALSSQDDPAWIELVLMESLVLIPEGQTKVLFVEQ